MPEIVEGKKVFTLGEFAASIQRAFGSLYNGTYWLKAEISKLNFFPRSGHCYPELSETVDGSVSAAFTGFIHKDTYKKLNEKFLNTIGEPLHDGIKIIAQCGIHFSTTRGVRLTISDIDINAILGEQARMRRETVAQLKTEGVYARNKTLALPRIIKKIAVISVESGKGYADFISIINTANGFRISTQLFPALMMGPESAGQMTAALKKIIERASEFDAVCIIRGGGGENTLQCFNDLTLCRAIALSPLPVMTGIGHATNLTVAEEVANTSFISPSELANFLIDRYSGEVARFRALTGKIAIMLQRGLHGCAGRLDVPVKNLRYKFAVVFRSKNNVIDGSYRSIKLKISNVFQRRRYAIHTIASRIAHTANLICQKSQRSVEQIETQMHGATVRQFPLKAGFPARLSMAAEPGGGVIFMRDSQVVTDISAFCAGDIIRIITEKGELTAKIMTTDFKK